MKLLGRFLKYVAWDTQSDPDSYSVPSTEGQTHFLQMLADDLNSLGISEIELKTEGYLTATIAATPGCEGEPTIGFLAHVDTSPDASGRNVHPQLTEYQGDTIITSDGTTLLGADDKAGVAEIVTAAEWLASHPEAAHGRIRLAFTTDEEIGRGADLFDIQAFGADFAYTVDGGGLGELEFENFNAAGAQVFFTGRSAHPGDAKGKMLNALRVAHEFDKALGDDRPETTEGREGFVHQTRLQGTVARAEAEYIVRDHDRTRFEERKNLLVQTAARLNEKYGPTAVSVIVNDQYFNMLEVMERHPEVVERAVRAMRAAGVEPVVRPIRGGTDGARLSHMGLPCPNIFTGGANFHSHNEFASLHAMQKAVQTIINIAMY